MDMKQRHGAERDILIAQLLRLGEIAAGDRQILLGQLHHLGARRGAGGMQDKPRCAGLRHGWQIGPRRGGLKQCVIKRQAGKTRSGNCGMGCGAGALSQQPNHGLR